MIAKWCNMGFSTNVKKGWYIIHTIRWVYRPTQMGNNHLNTNNWFPDFRFFFNLKSLFLILTSSTCRQLLHWFLKFFHLKRLTLMSAEHMPLSCTYDSTWLWVIWVQSALEAGSITLSKSSRSPTPFRTWKANTSRSCKSK